MPLTSLLAIATLAFSLAAEIPRKAPELAIKMSPSGEKLLSSLRGKTVVLTCISTTCPHCQNLTGTLNRISQEYAAKGVVVYGMAFDPDASLKIDGFKSQFRPNYPLGWQTRDVALEFLQHSPIMQLYVPIILIIDKNGMIREQHLGDDTAYQTKADESLRKSLDTILASPMKTKAATATSASAKKKS